MPALTAEQVERAIDACRAHLAEMAETFRGGLDCGIRLQAGQPHPLADAALADEALTPLHGPGLAVSLVLGEQALLLLIPEPIPLPAWYRQPGISENNRLQTFAHELSLQLLPADLQASRYSARSAASLKEFAEQAGINPDATALDLPVFLANAAETDAPIANILVIVPVNAPAAANDDPPAAPVDTGPAQAAAADSMDAIPGELTDDALDPDAVQVDATDDPDAVQTGNAESDDAQIETAAPLLTGSALEEALRALRILNVPVTVSVRLAERKMPLGQIVALVPGALVPFNKSCEDLLDLFVKNHRYCQGEAIKIGEHFGIKIAKVGVTEERKERVF